MGADSVCLQQKKKSNRISQSNRVCPRRRCGRITSPAGLAPRVRSPRPAAFPWGRVRGLPQGTGPMSNRHYPPLRGERAEPPPFCTIKVQRPALFHCITYNRKYFIRFRGGAEATSTRSPDGWNKPPSRGRTLPGFFVFLPPVHH
jgi:hypothetical protein